MRRYSLTVELPVIENTFNLTNKTDFEYTPIFNASPTSLLPVITCFKPDNLTMMRWGIPPEFARDKPVAERISTVHFNDLKDKNSRNRTLLNNQRVLIPVDGIYLFKKIGNNSTVAFRMCMLDASLFAIAGVFEDFSINNRTTKIFKMITKCYDKTENLYLPKFVKATDTLPCIIPVESWEPWLYQHTTSNDLELILENHFLPQTKHYPVTHRVTQINYNHPEVILKVLPMNNRGEYTLFD